MVARGSCQVNGRKGEGRVKQKGGRGRSDFEGKMTERTEENREIQRFTPLQKGRPKEKKERRKKVWKIARKSKLPSSRCGVLAGCG